MSLKENVDFKNYVFIIAAVAALNNCNLGYDMGIVSGVGPILQKQTEFEVSDVQLEIFIGALDISALIGAASSNYLADRFGRKGCMALSELLFVISVLGMACAQNYPTLIVFRCVCGVAVGLGLTIGPLYIGELAPNDIRGKLISWSELATNVGLLVAFCIGASFSGLPMDTSWRVMLALGSLLPSLLLACLYFMPESPRWLIVNGRESEAEAVLRKIYHGDVDTVQMVRDIKEQIEAEEALYTQGGWHAIIHPTRPVFFALLAGVGIASIQQLSGIEAITSYFVFIFERAGLETSDAFVYLILFGVCKLLTVYFASKLFDSPNYGRRPLLLISGLGVTAAMLTFCLIFTFPITEASKGVAVFIMFWYVIFYSIGYGPGTWVVMLEVLPMQIRAKGLSMATFVNRIMATFLSGSFLTLVEYMSYPGYFLFFTIISIGCVLYVYFLIPETRGRTLEAMSEVFGDDPARNDSVVVRTHSDSSEDGTAHTNSEKMLEDDVSFHDYGSVGRPRGNSTVAKGPSVVAPFHEVTM